MADIALRQGAGPADTETFRGLLIEYAEALNVSLCFQNFDDELATLPGAYAPPRGCWLLAHCDGTLAGCGALRPLADGAGELKRLYVRPAFRSFGIGRRLAEAIVAAGDARGYPAIRLDTMPSMKAARRLYRELGFQDTVAYAQSSGSGAPGSVSQPELLFMERRSGTAGA